MGTTWLAGRVPRSLLQYFIIDEGQAARHNEIQDTLLEGEGGSFFAASKRPHKPSLPSVTLSFYEFVFKVCARGVIAFFYSFKALIWPERLELGRLCLPYRFSSSYLRYLSLLTQR